MRGIHLSLQRWLAVSVLALACARLGAGEPSRSIFDVNENAAALPSAAHPATRSASGTTAPSGRLPIPTRDQQAAALAALRAAHPAAYANPAPAARRALAASLLQQAENPGNPAATQFALLRDAADVAALAGDDATASSAIDLAARRFAMSPLQELEVRSAAVARLAESAADAEASRRIGSAAIAWAYVALRMEQFETADRCIAAADSTAARLADAALAASVKTAQRDVAAARVEVVAAREAEATLRRFPDDTGANLVVGRYRCLVLGDWDGGMPHLAKCDDVPLRGMAEQALAAFAPEQRMANANAWWDWSERQPPFIRERVRQYAGETYRSVQTEVSWLAKRLATRRIAELPANVRVSLASVPPPIRAAVAPPTSATVGPTTIASGTPAVRPHPTSAPASEPEPTSGPPGIPVAARIQGKRGITEPAPGVITFDAPRGDGRSGAKGVLLRNAPDWRTAGTAWHCTYSRSRSAVGVQFIHPLGSGHVLVHVTAKSIGIFQPTSFTEAGYRSGDIRTLDVTQAYATLFPMKDDQQYVITSRLTHGGAYSIAVNGQVVARARITSAPPAIALPATAGFKALIGVLPEQLEPGDAALIVGPLDSGQNTCVNVRLMPANGVSPTATTMPAAGATPGTVVRGPTTSPAAGATPLPAQTQPAELGPPRGPPMIADISAKADWTTAGTVQRGERLVISATGEWWINYTSRPEYATAPDGVNRAGAKREGGELIGRFGAAGEPFLVGKGTTVIAPVDGEIQFRVRDTQQKDNAGAVKVTVERR